MSNSSLATYTKLSPNCTKPRNHKIDTITPHCVVGQFTAKEILNMSHFTTYDPDNGSSCNYAIGYDGSIGLGVEECNKSWCSSNKYNDHRAITIEIASDREHPYYMTDEALKALVNLCVDICQRNVINQLLWKGNKNLIGQTDKQNITVHRWFANKACPGDYLYNRLDEIANQVNNKLKGDEEDIMTGEEIYKALKEYLGTINVGDWAEDSWLKVTQDKIMDGSRPADNITRQEIAVILDRLNLLGGK